MLDAICNRHEQRLQAAQFIIDCDPQGLEGAGGGIDATFGWVHGDDRAHQIRQLTSAEYRRALARLHKFPRDDSRGALFAVFEQDAGQFSFAEGGDQIGGGGAFVHIHAHIEGSVAFETEAAGGFVDVVAGEAQVGQEHVGGRAPGFEGVADGGEVAVMGADGCSGGGLGDVGLGQGKVAGVGVVQDDGAAGLGACGDGGGVTPEAGGAVEIGFVGVRSGCKDGDAVGEQDRGVGGVVGGGGRSGHGGGYGDVSGRGECGERRRAGVGREGRVGREDEVVSLAKWGQLPTNLPVQVERLGVPRIATPIGETAEVIA